MPWLAPVEGHTVVEGRVSYRPSGGLGRLAAGRSESGAGTSRPHLHACAPPSMGAATSACAPATTPAKRRMPPPLIQRRKFFVVLDGEEKCSAGACRV
jgi:hypothetical protein